MTSSAAKLLRQPVHPQTFLRRAMIFGITLAITQLCHLSVSVEANSGDFAVWWIVNGVALISLSLLRHSARNCNAYIFIPWKILTILLLIALVFKISSRVPYIQSWQAEGLLSTRNNPELGNGGWYTYGSIFFYPLSILLALCSMPRLMFRLSLIGVLAICFIDYIVIGTRNVPTFVLVFYFLTTPIQFNFKRALLVGSVLAISFITIFNYSTINRLHASVNSSFNWIVLMKYTVSAEVLEFDEEFTASIHKSMPILMPTIFLAHYLTHPISELNYFIDKSESLRLAGFYGIKDQLCVIGACDRVKSQKEIERSNPRAGVYQTIWTSLILDFGWIGGVFIYVTTVLMLYGMQRTRPRQLGFSLVIFNQIIMLSPIENYLYNGLGFVQILLPFFIIFIIRFLYRLKFK